MNENDTRLRTEQQKTLGNRLFLFGSRRINSILQWLPRSVRENATAWNMNTPRTGSVYAGDSRPGGRQPALVHARVPVDPNESAGARRHQLPFDRGTEDKPDERSLIYRQSTENASRETQNTERTGSVTVLPQKIQSLFSGLFRMRLPSVTVRQDAASDAFLKHNHADAMTIGTDIYFKSGMFDPAGRRGLGLLGHELIHAAENAGFDHPGTAGVRSRELNEKNALAHERLVLEHALVPRTSNAGLLGAASASPHEAPRSASPPAQSPQFAESSRQVEQAASPAPGAAKSGILSDRDMMRIKEEVYRDLMMRIKIDFERGA